MFWMSLVDFITFGGNGQHFSQRQPYIFLQPKAFSSRTKLRLDEYWFWDMIFIVDNVVLGSHLVCFLMIKSSTCCHWVISRCSLPGTVLIFSIEILHLSHGQIVIVGTTTEYNIQQLEIISLWHKGYFHSINLYWEIYINMSYILYSYYLH